MADLHLVIVTPETTTFDETVDSVILPLVDGEAGILPGHAPMIGRLGPGELRTVSGGQTQRFYVDGGFAQVTGKTVTVLPGRSIPADKIDVAAAEKALQDAQGEVAATTELAELKSRSIAQAKAQLRIAGRS